MHGTYDPTHHLGYTVLGADLLVRSGSVNVRAEYLIRRTQIGVSATPEDQLRYGPVGGHYGNFTVKDGFYVEAEGPLMVGSRASCGSMGCGAWATWPVRARCARTALCCAAPRASTS